MSAAQEKRITELEIRAGVLEAKLRAVFRCIEEANRHAGWPTEPVREAAKAAESLGKAERIKQLGLSVVGGSEAS